MKWRASSVLIRTNSIYFCWTRLRSAAVFSELPKEDFPCSGGRGPPVGASCLTSSQSSHCWDVWLLPVSVPSLSYKYFILSVPTASNIFFFKWHFLFPFFPDLVLVFQNTPATRVALRHALGFPPNVIALKLQIVGKSNFLSITEDSSSSHPSCKSLSPSPAFSLLLCNAQHRACGTSAFQNYALAFPGSSGAWWGPLWRG